MLETIREFGQEHLAASGQEQETRSRFAEWGLDFAARAGRQVRGSEATEWLAALERDHANLLSILAWLRNREDGARLLRLAGSLFTFWQEHAHYSEGRHWLDAALKMGREAPAEDRLRAMTGLGVLSWYKGEIAFSRQTHEQALSLAREIGDRGAEAFELGSAAAHASELGDYERATALFEESLAVAREVGDPGPVALALHNLAHQDWEQGEPARAMARLEEAREVAREHRLDWILPSILIGLGTIATDPGEPARAAGYFRESLAAAQARGNLDDLTDGIGGMARLAAATGEAETATRLLGAADTLRESLGVTISPGEQEDLDTIFNGLRAKLGEEVFAAAWASGRALSEQEAVAEALGLGDGLRLVARQP
jgi:tetratricopeptide (TPR) repeat protein